MQVNTALACFARGWKLIKLYGLRGPKVCTCWKGKDCGSPGKHPVEKAWHLHPAASEEEIMAWFEDSTPCNIGIVLGPASGVVDVELDGPEAKEAWAALGLGEIWTPTYTAGRGPHRLFKWDESLPAVAVKKVNGIEVRIGNGGMAAQSVLPPSMHHSGVSYTWVEGMSPDDVELQPLPERLVSLLWNDDGTGTVRDALPAPPARKLLNETVAESRNVTLHRFAVSQAFRAADLDDPMEQQDLLTIIRAVNAAQCKPPLDDGEVVSIYRSAIKYARKTRSMGMDHQTAIADAGRAMKDEAASGKKKKKPGTERKWISTMTDTGLVFAPMDPTPGTGPEWSPGEWQLIVVRGDPVEYRLHVPAWKKYTYNETGNIALSCDQFRSAARVAAAVLAATGVVMLDDSPGKWKAIWDGGYKVKDPRAGKKKSRVARGVKAKLLDTAVIETPGASSKRYVILAGWLYDRLSAAAQPSDDDIPDPTGRAAWRHDGTLWFAWGKIWEDIERQHRVLEGERLALKRRLLGAIGEREWRDQEYRHLGGQRRLYVVWGRREFAALEAMASEGADAPTEPDSTADGSPHPMTS